MARSLLYLVGICLLASAAVARNAYFCEVLFENFCPQGPARDTVCPRDPTVTLNNRQYPFSDFNAVSFDGFFARSGDVEGRALVRNNLNLPNGQYSFGYELRTQGVAAADNVLPFSLVVGHDATWLGDGAVLPDGSGFPYGGPRENIFVGGSFTTTTPNHYLQGSRTGSCSTAGCLDADFDNAQAYFKMLSESFNFLSDNAVASIQWGTLHLTCNSMASSQYVVHISPADFSTVTSWDFTGCNAESALVVNIVGAGNQVKFAGATQTKFRNERVVYNVVPTSSTPSVRVEVGVNGGLLAPLSQYNQPGMGVWIGQMVVGNIVETLQINRIYCVPQAPPTHPTEETCPGWETDCAGLDLTLDNFAYSFRDVNVISFNDFHATTSDVEGRLAVQRNAIIGSGYSIGDKLQTATSQPDRHLPYSLIVGNDLTWGSGSLYPNGDGIPFPGAKENMFVGGSFTSSQTDLHERRLGGPCASTGCLDSQFNAAKQCYSGYQNGMANTADNVDKVIEWSGLSITCRDASATSYTVSLTPSEMSQYTYTTTGNCNFQAKWTINIRGTGDVEITGASFPAVPGGVVYNIIGCGRTVNVHDTSVAGSILAPCSTLSQTSGVILGKVVAGDISSSWQINRENTCPARVIVPIPVVTVTPALQSTVATFSNDALRVGDSLMGATVVSNEGDNTYGFNAPVTASAGQVHFVQSNSYSSRTPDPVADKASASAISISAALIVSLIAFLLF